MTIDTNATSMPGKVLFYVKINVQLYDLYHTWKFKMFIWHIGYNRWNLYGLMAVSHRQSSSSAAAVLVIRCPYPSSSSPVVISHRHRLTSSFLSSAVLVVQRPCGPVIIHRCHLSSVVVVCCRRLLSSQSAVLVFLLSHKITKKTTQLYVDFLHVK